MSNGLNSPGQLDSASFRGSRPRKVGPRVVRLQQIATGGTVNPRRGGNPSVRTTEASTQAVIKAVYVQVLGNVMVGYIWRWCAFSLFWDRHGCLFLYGAESSKVSRVSTYVFKDSTGSYNAGNSD